MGLRPGVTPEFLTQIAGVFHPVIMVNIDWPGDPVYAHSNLGVIEWDGQDWQGVGDFGDIQMPPETSGVASMPVEFGLIGLPPEILQRMGDDVKNKLARILFGVTTERGGNVLAANPVEIWSGLVDTLDYELTDDAGNAVHGVIMQARSGPAAREAAAIYHTAEDQATEFPGDTAGRHVINMEAKGETLTWPE
jgi:hypothetical protein